MLMMLIYYAPFITQMRTTHPAHLILLNLTRDN